MAKTATATGMEVAESEVRVVTTVVKMEVEPAACAGCRASLLAGA